MDTTHQPPHTTPSRPDTTDWTVVIDEGCTQCGFHPIRPLGDIAPRLTASIARWQSVLERTDVAVRPEPDVWSPLEYACHVLDVSLVFTTRVEQMRSEDTPTFVGWDGEAAAIAEDYNARDPRSVAADYETATHRAAEFFASLEEDAWQRPGLRADGKRFTIATLADYWLHEIHHHLADVQG
ncbi:DinB family protein [Raineyella sp. LH-20]|uniref:DinB family protein n=1 Tax=Raineyella sp. LH-20 TaxID=3081204 RepID=UPI0029554F61|nr:DinB family protein [Raineyella sp. LH-20]WOP19446.1 DinB family protein [Raineyella sp. LH-20]